MRLSTPVMNTQRTARLGRGRTELLHHTSILVLAGGLPFANNMVGILFQTLHFPVFISSACIKKLQIVDGSGAVDNDERDWRLSHTE